MTSEQNQKEDAELLKRFEEIINSQLIIKFQNIIDLLYEGLGDKIYNDTKNNNHHILNILRSFARNHPKETIFIWQQIYQYLSEKELVNNERLEMATLYFWFGDTLFYDLKKKGYGKYYLKAYVEDIGFHDNFKHAGASEALKFRCYLGEKGLDIVDKELLKITKKKKMEELKEYIKSTTRGEFERLVVQLENIISLESNEDFFLPISSLKEVIKKIEPLIKTKDNQKSAKLLEFLCQVLFGSIRGFRYKFDERSLLFQIDGLISNSSNHPFLMELGKIITIEAKQYFHENEVSRNNIDILFMNMTRVNASSAFLVSSGQLSDPAKDEIYHTYLRTGKLIIFLSFNDIKDLAENKVLFPVLISQKISDIKSKRKIN
ncbi:MAG: restriction endonuclease [Nanoarchaeota archaeon]|nr:restriction endonuclease [Nanoarchaeota archaeon]